MTPAPEDHLRKDRREGALPGGLANDSFKVDIGASRGYRSIKPA